MDVNSNLLRDSLNDIKPFSLLAGFIGAIIFKANFHSQFDENKVVEELRVIECLSRQHKLIDSAHWFVLNAIRKIRGDDD